MTLEVVLVTGATGFLGAATVLDLLQRGYRVRAVARSQSKADQFSVPPETRDRIQWFTIPDLATPGAFDAALQDVDYVIHVASPVLFDFTDNKRDMLDPAIEGTMNLLRAAAEVPQVKHVVITSSLSAVMINPKDGHKYTEDDWNNSTYEEAAECPPGKQGFVYCASKALAEKAAWKFVVDDGAPFGLTVFCPPMIYGPPYQPFKSMDELNHSCVQIWNSISGGKGQSLLTSWPEGAPWIDVRDLATLHVDALKNPTAKNQRYLLAAGFITHSQATHIAASAFPEQAHRMAKSDNLPPTANWGVDSSKVERDFGIRWRTAEACIGDMAGLLYGKEREFSGRM
ncbi:NAD dependent epimerase/dehydratase [Calocera viscosa TUFC12733]|uniref:NAD dependent epimerase/dehydratase n=1 Tax=Calocera viscosa (strain TUFC12733) TaxID=1330018 RepID=A0A167QVW0_CALVF|nr:NAD dependent epimerase/dehydratase [Calocera viscosa TUFC12733]